MNTAPATTILAKWQSMHDAWAEGWAASPSPTDFARVYLDHTTLEVDPNAFDVIELVATCYSDYADLGVEPAEVLASMDMEYNVARVGG